MTLVHESIIQQTLSNDNRCFSPSMECIHRDFHRMRCVFFGPRGALLGRDLKSAANVLVFAVLVVPAADGRVHGVQPDVGVRVVVQRPHLRGAGRAAKGQDSRAGHEADRALPHARLFNGQAAALWPLPPRPCLPAAPPFLPRGSRARAHTTRAWRARRRRWSRIRPRPADATRRTVAFRPRSRGNAMGLFCVGLGVFLKRVLSPWSVFGGRGRARYLIGRPALAHVNALPASHENTSRN